MNESNNTSNTSGSLAVSANVTDWDITDSPGPGFVANFGATPGGTSVTRGGPPPGGNLDVSGTEVRSNIIFELGVGEVAPYAFNLDYTIDNSQGAKDSSISWSLVNTTTSATIFSGFDETGTGGTESTGLLTGDLTVAGTYELLIVAALNDTAIPPNSTGSTGFQGIFFSTPEPTSLTLASLSLCLLAFRRKRSHLS